MNNPPSIDLAGAKVLIVDDVPANLNILSDALEPAGYEVLAARSGEAALDLALHSRPDLILLDVMMPAWDGFETCRRLKADASTRDIPVLFVTARDETQSVLEGFQAGGVDYLTKPVQTEEVLIRVRTHLQIHFLARELARRNQALDATNQELARKNQELQAEIDQRRRAEQKVSALCQREAERWDLSKFIGQSGEFRRIVEEVGKVQRFTGTSVLISGESGTGKELIARAIHFGGPLLEGPFLPVNCSAIPRELAESMFFGHLRGAFSGAIADHKGYFEQAHEGTLFLDEIGDMPLELQAKLLRVLEDGLIVPIGAAKEKRVAVRVLAGTNVDLQAEVEAGKFRKDLYFRLAGFTIDVPPLRERREDVPLLANHFLRRLASEMGMAEPRLSAEAIAALEQYDFPGNVRELKNLIERSLIESGGGEVRAEHLHFCFSRARPGLPPGAGERFGQTAEVSKAPSLLGSDEEKVLAYVREAGSINNSQCRDLLAVGLHRACYLLRKLHRAGLLNRDHSRRSAQYRQGGTEYQGGKGSVPET
jgi:DNA-binding NtrC family response regulator